MRLQGSSRLRKRTPPDVAKISNGQILDANRKQTVQKQPYMKCFRWETTNVGELLKVTCTPLLQCT
jgi:hypothetical protein